MKSGGPPRQVPCSIQVKPSRLGEISVPRLRDFNFNSSLRSLTSPLYSSGTTTNNREGQSQLYRSSIKSSKNTIVLNRTPHHAVACAAAMPIKPIEGVRAPLESSLRACKNRIVADHTVIIDAKADTSPGFEHCRWAGHNVRISVVVWYVDPYCFHAQSSLKDQADNAQGFHLPRVRARDIYYAKLEDERARAAGFK
jgi:hypothetical protein